MSWSIAFIGKPEKVSESLIAHSEKISGKSKEEYDSALPHLIGLVNQNLCDEKYPSAIKVEANGHGYDGFNSCNASIQNIGLLV